MQTLNEIRSTFLNYFDSNAHTVVPSSPLIPRNDPTLMFTAAGMVQFKNLFTGAETRDYSRAVTAQKCVRRGASITISTMSGIPRATILSSRCSVTSVLAIISRKTRSRLHGIF